ncbi:MAG TPA: polyprenyl synthetase family protein [Thermoanaerobaculia bacterium]|nr:polyprenyl synthetase family protein [Thermoanaerobaculia bacterium]
MTFDAMKARVRGLPEVAAWPEMLALMERVVHRESLSVWDYPAIVCEAVGGNPAIALPGGAAVFCSLISIHLIDDMLDEDVNGDYRLLGAGKVANLGIAFQSAGHRLLDDLALPGAARAALQACLAKMALGTAFGQGLDAREVTSEEEYWQVVEAKTPPLFGAAFRLGALIGGAPETLVQGLENLGGILGRLVQVSDDLSDSLQIPAGADWRRRANNLPILFAMTAEHPDREHFLNVSLEVETPEALAAAQKILLASGAVSYCAFKMFEFSKAAEDLLAGLPLPNPEPITRLLAAHMVPLYRMLASVGVEEPATLTIG